MIRIFTHVLVYGLLNSNALFAFELSGENIYIQEVLPLFNKHETSHYVALKERVINPKDITIPVSAKIGTVNKKISMKGFIGETFFKDILLTTTALDLDVQVSVHDENLSGIKITPKIVTNWYQAGISTTQKKFSGALTYELLLSDDRNVSFNDMWVKSNEGGWVYVPPDVDFSNTLKTKLTIHSNKRILLKVALDQEVLPGRYSLVLEIVTYKNKTKHSLFVPIELDVLAIKLIEDVSDKYKLFLYTAFKLNERIERSGAYINAMRLYGANKEKEDLFSKYISDIKEHGFNGITVHDWDTNTLENTLRITQHAGIKYVVLHAATPVSKKYKDKLNPIASDSVKAIYEKATTELYFYGYDESGGNKYLEKQLKLNQQIHSVMGKSVNAIFWDDMPNVITEINNNKSKCFDIIAYSMGSHGQKEMFASLPYKRKDDFCSRLGTEFLTYWHPHVENPVINRIFMGFWLWASGFDGVIPHGYYFPSHIERVITNEDLKRGVSYATSPYNDWSYWLPGGALRHHNAVYPSKEGPVGTLQWEGVLNGYMDLRYVLTLEEKLNNNISRSYREKITVLLNEIRRDVLKIDSPYMNDKDSIKYLRKLEFWKQEISKLLLN